MAFAEADSFCTVAEVEGLVGRGTFGASTVPTLQKVLDQMALRAAALEVVLASIGVQKTVPNGSAPLSQTGADARLFRLCQNANAFQAAADAIMMGQVRDTNSVPEKAKAYLVMADDVIDVIKAAGKADATGQNIDRSFTNPEALADTSSDLNDMNAEF